MWPPISSSCISWKREWFRREKQFDPNTRSALPALRVPATVVWGHKHKASSKGPPLLWGAVLREENDWAGTQNDSTASSLLLIHFRLRLYVYIYILHIERIPCHNPWDSLWIVETTRVKSMEDKGLLHFTNGATYPSLMSIKHSALDHLQWWDSDVGKFWNKVIVCRFSTYEKIKQLNS